MIDPSIFNNGDEGSQSQSGQGNNDDATADQLLSAIVNSDGKQKYATVEEALKGAAAAQEHIGRIEEENTVFKQGAEKSTTLQDVLDAMKPKEGEGEKEPTPAQLNKADVAEMLTGILEKRDTAATAKTNTTSVATKFKELHGEEAEAKYYEAAAGMGFSREEINRLAASNPTAVYKVLGVDVEKEQPDLALRSDVNSGEFSKEQPKPQRFNPFNGGANPQLEAFRKSAAATKERLGVTD